MKVGVAIPVNGREPLLYHTIERLKKQNHKDIEIIIVGETESEKEVAKKCGIDFYRHKNFPLGKKWQFGINKLRERECDAVLILGSSDWISDSYITKILSNNYDQKKIGMVGVRDIFFLDIQENNIFEMYHWPGYEYVEAIRHIQSVLKDTTKEVRKSFDIMKKRNGKLEEKRERIQRIKRDLKTIDEMTENIESYVNEFENKTDNIAVNILNRLAEYKVSSGKRDDEPIGAGRIIFKPTLDQLNWKIFDVVNNSLDWSTYLKIKKINKKIIMLQNDDILKVLSISTFKWQNKHKFNAGTTIPGAKFYTPDEINDFIDKYFPETKLIFKTES